MKASSLTPERRVMMLLKSSPGFGKTIAACSAAVDGPVFLAYFDKNAPTELLHFFKKHRPELLDNIEYEIYGAQNANDYLNKLIKLRNDCRYTAIITDSATTLTSAAVNWSMGFRDPKGPKKDKVDSSSVQIIPDFDEYKVETSLVTQALDISMTLPCHIIWTCHPLPQMKIEGTGNSMRVSKASSIVTYGSKVGAMIPARFNEVYHLVLENSWSDGAYQTKRKVSTVPVGDDFARTVLDLPQEFDITDKLFWEVWQNLLKEKKEDGVKEAIAESNQSESKWKT